MMFEPGEYRTKNGTLARVTHISAYWVGKHKHQFIEGYIDGNPAMWNLDGSHSAGNYVLPGHAAFDLVHETETP